MIAMDFLSHELYAQLKEVGFPQPEISAGQFWYVYPTRDGRFSDIQLAVVFKEEGGDDFLIRLCDGGIVYCENDCDYMVFVPTIEDILREMPIECGIFRVDTPYGVKWMCVELEDGDSVGLKALRDTPVGAAVMKWGEVKMRNS